jgi:hypothetical protein
MSPTKHEEWRDCVGFEGYYQVSNLGNIRSCDRLVFNKGSGASYKRKGQVLKPRIDAYGYLITDFWVKGEKTTVKLHRLVLDAFIGPENGKCCDHINGVRDDNKLENLRWATAKENNANRTVCIAKSGHRGVRFRKDRGCWQSYGHVEGVFHHIAYCETKAEAIASRSEWEKNHVTN